MQLYQWSNDMPNVYCFLVYLTYIYIRQTAWKGHQGMVIILIMKKNGAGLTHWHHFLYIQYIGGPVQSSGWCTDMQ